MKGNLEASVLTTCMGNPTHSKPMSLLFPLETNVHVLGYRLFSLADQQ